MTPAATPAVAPVGSEENDDEVIRQVLQGNTARFEVLMRRHTERVYRAARAIVRDDDEAEDVMQQTYVNAFTHLRQFTGAAQPGERFVDGDAGQPGRELRRRGMYEVLDEEKPHVAPIMTRTSATPEHEAFARELRVLLEWAIDTLPDGMREVFVLRDVQGLSTAEVAECLGVSEDAVKTRLSRGRASLRRLLLDRTGATAADAFRFHCSRCDRVVGAVLARIDPR